MAISFTRTNSSIVSSLIDILRSDGSHYQTSAPYVNEAKQATLEAVNTNEHIELLDDIANMVVVAHGRNWCELVFSQRKGMVTVELRRYANEPSQDDDVFLSRNGHIIPQLRMLLENNPKTKASFFYAMGTLDTLKSQDLISEKQHQYWLSLFKPK